MSSSLYPLVAALAVLVVLYVHAGIPRFTERGPKRVIAHVLLLVVGVMFGVISAMVFGAVAPPWAVVATGVGLVHLPTLCVLIVKQLRHSGPS